MAEDSEEEEESSTSIAAGVAVAFFAAGAFAGVSFCYHSILLVLHGRHDRKGNLPRYPNPIRTRKKR